MILDASVIALLVCSRVVVADPEVSTTGGATEDEVASSSEEEAGGATVEVEDGMVVVSVTTSEVEEAAVDSSEADGMVVVSEVSAADSEVVVDEAGASEVEVSSSVVEEASSVVEVASSEVEVEVSSSVEVVVDDLEVEVEVVEDEADPSTALPWAEHEDSKAGMAVSALPSGQMLLRHSLTAAPFSVQIQSKSFKSEQDFSLEIWATQAKRQAGGVATTTEEAVKAVSETTVENLIVDC